MRLMLSRLQTLQVAAWRALYQFSATEQSWEKTHRWRYSKEVALKTIDDIRSKLAVSSAELILEVGCGCGMVCELLAGDNQKAVGLDLSEDLLQRAEDFGVSRQKVALVAAEASQLPLRDASFDRVLCYSVFQCFPSKRYAKQVLNELMRVCRPGGMILVGDVFQQPRMGPLRYFNRTILGMLRTLRLRIRLRIHPFNKTTTAEQLSARYVLQRRYSQRFFKKALRNNNCCVELMPQQIAGRRIYDRFDVRIVKSHQNKGK